jgi:hypothetical protein
MRMGREMEDQSSVFDILAWPVFPDQPWPQMAFIAALLLGLGGLAMLAFPSAIGRIIGLEGSQKRPEAIGELRSVGGFLAGYGVATLMFFDQPILPAALGVAMAVATFARLISLLSDNTATVLNVLMLAVQGIFSVALLYYFGDVATGDLTYGVPTEIMPQLVFLSFAGLAVVGFLVLFAPGTAMKIAGLALTPDKQGGFASVRSTGGFMLGMGGMGMAMAGSWQTQFILLLMLCFGIVIALVLSVIGRLLAIVINRGNFGYNVAALVVQAATAAVVMTYVAGAM